MRYSYEFKKECVELHRQGIWADTPEGVSTESFRSKIRKWHRLEDLHGPEMLRASGLQKEWSADQKLELISRTFAGEPVSKVAESIGIGDGMLHQWIRRYKMYGYNGLVNKRRGRKSKRPKMKKQTNPTPLTESEREELIRLRAEVEYIKAENEVIKKEIALREEKEAARLKAKKQQSLQNSATKDSD